MYAPRGRAGVGGGGQVSVDIPIAYYMQEGGRGGPDSL